MDATSLADLEAAISAAVPILVTSLVGIAVACMTLPLTARGLIIAYQAARKFLRI